MNLFLFTLICQCSNAKTSVVWLLSMKYGSLLFDRKSKVINDLTKNNNPVTFPTYLKYFHEKNIDY